MSFLQMTVSGGVMILVIALIRAAALQRMPKAVFPALWAIACLRLLLPFSLPAPTSVYSILAPSAPSARVIDHPATFQPQVSQPAQAAAPAVWAEGPDRTDLFTLLWSIGLCLCLLYFAVSYFRCRRKFRYAVPAGGDSITAFLAGHPLRRKLSVRQSDQIAVPMTYGLLRPVILLPDSLVLTDDSSLTYVLAHELVHIRRFDGLFKLVLILTACVHWFNPAVWLMFVLANRDIELRCDEAVIRQMPGDVRGSYAAALISLEAEKSGLSPLYNSFSKSAIETRIRAIMKYKKATLGVLLTALVLITGVVAVFATSAQENNDTSVNVLGVVRISPTNDDILEEYGPYGVTFDEDGNMRYDGYIVRYFWDGYELTDGGEPFIRATRYEYANPQGFADIRTVRERIYNDDGSIDNMGPILKIERYVEENFDLYVNPTPQQAAAEGSVDDGITFEEIFSRYADFGIRYEPTSGGRGNVYMEDQLIGLFVDQASPGHSGVFTYQSEEESPLTAYTVRDRWNNVIEIQLVENVDTNTALEEKQKQEALHNMERIMANYAPFGLTTDCYLSGRIVTRDMEYQGKQVRSFEDRGWRFTGVFGNDLDAYDADAIDLYAVYDGDTLIGLAEPTGELRAEWDTWLQRVDGQS